MMQPRWTARTPSAPVLHHRSAARPTTFFLFITGIIGAFQIFTEVYIMTNGGPVNRTTTIGYYLYMNAFPRTGYGIRNSHGICPVRYDLCFTLIQWKYTCGDVEY